MASKLEFGRLTAVLSAFSVGSALFAATAHDSTNLWNVADGNAAVAANYDPATAPGANTQVRIANGGLMRIDSDLSWGALWCGYGTNGEVRQTAGTLTLNNSGAASGDGTLWLGYNSANNGWYTLSGGVLDVVAGNPQIGRQGCGRLVLSGGEFKTGAAYPSVGRNGTGVGFVDVFGTGRLMASNARQLSVGEDGKGLLRVRDGGEVDVSKLVLGANGTGYGALNVSSGGVVRAKEIVGGSGAARWVVAAGGTIQVKADGAAVDGFFSNVDVQVAPGGLRLDTNGKDVSLASSLVRGCSLRADDLAHRWSFSGDLADSVGGQDIVLQGSNKGQIVVAEGQLRLPGAAHQTAYAELGAGIVPTGCSGATVEFWTTQVNPRTWARIFTCQGSDWKSSFMSWVGGSTGADPAGDYVSAAGVTVGGKMAPWTPWTEFHVVVRLVKTATGGTVEFQKRDPVSGSMLKSYTFTIAQDGWEPAKLTSNFFNIGWSTDGGNDDASALYNEIRVWKRALTDDELGASARLGPDADFSAAPKFVKTGAGALTLQSANAYDGDTIVEAGSLASAPLEQPIHRWTFNGTYADSFGTATATPYGDQKSGIELGETTVKLPGADPHKAHVRLGSGLWSGCASGFTFEFWVQPNASLKWSRIFTCDSGSYTCPKQPRLFMTLVGGSGTDPNRDYVGINGGNADGPQPGDKMAPWTVGTWYHVAVVGRKQSSGIWNLTFFKYDVASGELKNQYACDAAEGWEPAQFKSDSFNLGWSPNGGDMDAAATFDEVRIWNRALTADELALSTALGPDALPSLGKTAAATGSLPTTTDLKVEAGASFVLADANQTVKTVSGAGTIVGPGTLTVTEAFRPGALSLAAGTKLVGTCAFGTGDLLTFVPGPAFDVSGIKIRVLNPEVIGVDSPVKIMSVAGATLTGTFDIGDSSMENLKLKVTDAGDVVVRRKGGLVLIFK